MAGVCHECGITKVFAHKNTQCRQADKNRRAGTSEGVGKGVGGGP